MKKLHWLILCAVATFTFGCATTPVGSVKMPQPTPAFSAKQTYTVTRDKLWEAILTALDNNRIATASSDKASGRLQTDYIEGPSALIGGGFVGAQSTRYKFSISLRDQSGGAVKLNIVCKLESTIKGTAGASQWNDVSSHNPQLVKNAEDWLYEQIEKGL